MTIISLGLFLSSFTRGNFTEEVEHSVHAYWTYISYAAETIIFFVVGVIIGYNIILVF